LRDNSIGINAAGYGVAQHANEVGILVSGGSGQHVIGAASNDNVIPGAFYNDIRNNDTAGVQLNSSAGSGVTIRGNRIEANARSGIGLGIDLGDLGPSPNDDGDADAGPNGMQNYPVITASAPNGDTRQVTATLNTNPSAVFRIDFYRSPSCPGGQAGVNATTLVGTSSVSSGSNGPAEFTAELDPTGAPGYLTATATSVTGPTSELSPCFSEDTIFRNGLEKPGL
jgi:hypothetical protein